MRPAVGAVEAHRDQALGRCQVDSIGLAGKVGPARAASRADHGGVAPFGGNPDEVEHRSRSIGRFHPGLPRCSQGHDALAVGRPDRLAVESAGAREPLGLALAVGGPLPDMAALGRPAHVRQGLAIGRPARLKLARIGRREPPRLAVGQVHHVKLRQGREGQVLAVRRGHGRLDQPRLDRAVIHPDREVEPRADRLRHPGRERDHLVRSGLHVEPVDLAAISRQHRLAVGRERIARNQVTRVPRLLLVALNGELEPALLAAMQVADPQPGLVVDARSIHQHLFHPAKSPVEIRCRGRR